MRNIIHSFEHIETDTKVRMLYALGASVDANFLEELKERAFVEVDEKYRITYYEAIIDGLELSGDHSHSMKLKTAKLKSKRSLLRMINGYFKNKDNADVIPKTYEEKEMWNLFKFITEKCETIDSPLNISQFICDFNDHFGISKATGTIRNRITKYSRAIQKVEFLDTSSKVKQLFGLSVTVNPNYLEKLREEAVVKVDSQNRIIEFTSNDGSLKFKGRHWGSKLAPSQYVDRMNNSMRMLTDSDEDDEEYHESIDFTNRSPPTFKTPKSSKRKADNSGFTSSKRTRDYNPIHSFNDQPRFELQKFPGSIDELLDDCDYSIDDRVKLEPFRGSIQEDFKEIEEDEDIQQIPRPFQALEEHNQIEELPIKEEQEESFENSTGPLEVKPVQKLDKHNELTEVPVKIEHEEPVEVKPETSHNSKIRFFETMQSLILCLDTPSLFSIQSKIHQKVQKLKGSDEVIFNNEVVLNIEFLIAQITNHSVLNLSKNVESVNLSNFFCYLKAAILNSKMCGLEGLVKNICKRIEKSQNKRIPMEKVANALRATLDVDCF